VDGAFQVEAPMNRAHRVQVVDSHTGGEPTRVIIDGGPNLRGATMQEKLEDFRVNHDDFRSAVILEPRGSDVLVGALLVEPTDASCVAGVIFFDNVYCIGMCGHGTIGVAVTLAHLGRIQTGKHRLETPVGVVTFTLEENNTVSVENVPAYRKTKEAAIDVPGAGRIVGDVAYGGNWFFLTEQCEGPLDCAHLDQLTELAWRIRLAVNAQGFPEVDHVILLNGSRNFVLCPGKAYDRSPCGTGTSARLACLAADGELAEGESYVQQSIIGSEFRGSYRWLDRAKGIIAPTITGRAYVTGEGTLLLDPRDPYCFGIPAII
jgi:proline racemase